MVLPTYKPNTWETKARGWQVLGWPKIIINNSGQETGRQVTSDLSPQIFLCSPSLILRTSALQHTCYCLSFLPAQTVTDHLDLLLQPSPTSRSCFIPAPNSSKHSLGIVRPLQPGKQTVDIPNPNPQSHPLLCGRQPTVAFPHSLQPFPGN